MRDEGLRVPFPMILAEAVFANNVLLSIHGTTPYKALFGEVPNLMADFDKAGMQINDEDAGIPGASRHRHRLREIS